jgi:TRAP-type C4-dicarboxylate transport system permease small subunit
LGISAIGVALLAALVSWAVFMRWVFGDSPHWAEELPQFILIWTAMLGAVWCSRRDTHLKAGLLDLWLHNEKARWWIDRTIDALLVVAMLILAKAGWDLAMMTINHKSPALQWPVGLLYMSVPVSCIAIALVHIGKLVNKGSAADE